MVVGQSRTRRESSFLPERGRAAPQVEPCSGNFRTWLHGDQMEQLLNVNHQLGGWRRPVLNKCIIELTDASSPHSDPTPSLPALSYLEEANGLQPLERNLCDTKR